MKVFRYYQHFGDGNTRVSVWVPDTPDNRIRERNMFYGTAEVRIQCATLSNWADLYKPKFMESAHHEMMRHNNSFKG